MKFKVFFISIFLLHSSFIFAENTPLKVGDWIRVSEAETGYASVYIDKKNIVKRDGRLFFWLMTNMDMENSSDVNSVKELIVTDCKKPVSYESLTKNFYEGFMASGNFIGESSEDKGKIQYPIPNNFYGGAIDLICRTLMD